MRRLLLLAALALPILGLGAAIWSNERALATAEQLTIPVSGHDPRDVLRGRYVRFQYDWIFSGDAGPCLDGACALCLDQRGTAISATLEVAGSTCDRRVDLRASRIRVLRRPTGMQGGFTFSSRIFVAEARAPELEKMLAARPMVMRARLTAAGRLVNDELIPLESE